MIHELRPDMEIEGPLTTTSEVISRLSEHSGYDLIFSDIRLRGQEVFSAFQTVMPECMVIFTTAYDEYALKAFKSNIDAAIGELRSYRERILIWKGEELIPVNVNDILYFYFDQRHVYAKSTDGDIHSVQFTMHELESELDPKMFFRLNRQYIANICSIARISMSFNSRLLIRLRGCDQPLTLSKEKSTELQGWLDR